MSTPERPVEVAALAQTEAPAAAPSTIEAAMAAVSLPQGMLPPPEPTTQAEADTPPETEAMAVQTTAPAVAESAVAKVDTLEQDGLVMVETSRTKVEAWQSTVTAAVEPPPPPRRRPRQTVEVADEPLLQVETRK